MAEATTTRIIRHAVGHPVDTEPPKVDVCIVNSRGELHPWTLQAMNSVKEQSYPHTGLIVVDNNDHALSIGQAYNQAVQASDAKFVAFLGDDDMLCVDLIASSVWCYDQAVRMTAPQLVHVTSNTMLLIEQSGGIIPSLFAHQGMYLREWLLTNPFDEHLAQGVGYDMHTRMQRTAQLRNSPLSLPMMHHYGYVWRQHIGMVSGMRITAQTNGTR